MTDRLEVRAIAAQLIHNAIQRIDCEIAADHILDTYPEDVDVDSLAFPAEAAVRTATVHLTGDETRWTIRHDGKQLHTTDSRAEAETIGQLLVRTATGDDTVRVQWACPVCDGEDFCPNCGEGLPAVLVARGVITAGEYSIEPVRPAAA